MFLAQLDQYKGVNMHTVRNALYLGTRPMPELWRRWNFKHLDPPDSLKTIGEENEQVRLKKCQFFFAFSPSSLLKQLPFPAFDLDTLVEETRASVREDTPSIIELHSGRKQGADVGSSSEKISRDDLEEVLSGKKLQGQLVEGGGDEVTPSSVVGSKLDLARSQYISLCERRGGRDRSGSHNDRGKLQAGGTCQRSVNTQLRHPNQAMPFRSAGPPHKLHLKESEQSSTLSVPAPLPPRGPNKTTGNQNSQPQPLPRSQNGSISTLKPPTGAAAGRTQQAVRPNQRANVKSTGGRTAKGARTHTGKVQTSPTRGTPVSHIMVLRNSVCVCVMLMLCVCFRKHPLLGTKEARLQPLRKREHHQSPGKRSQLAAQGL